MSDLAWIDSALTSARPQAVGALLRYFRDLDRAEEAFQEACLRALKNWPVNGPPRDPTAWLIMVGRNFALDDVRRREEERGAAAGRADLRPRRRRGRHRRTARQLALPRRRPPAPLHLLPPRAAGDAAGRAGAPHRLRPDGRRDRARLPGRRQRHGAAHHARQAADRRGRHTLRHARARSSAPNGSAPSPRWSISSSTKATRRPAARPTSALPLCEEAIRLARLLLRLFPSEPEIMGLTALLLLQHARAPARLDADGNIVLLDDQDRASGSAT